MAWKLFAKPTIFSLYLSLILSFTIFFYTPKAKYSKIKFTWSKFSQSFSKTFDLLNLGSANVFGEIKNLYR